MSLLLKTSIKVKMIPCIKCGNDMPELRKTQYGYNFCVNCSTVGTKRGIPVQMGTGDHTWTETIIMEEDEYNKYSLQNNTPKKSKSTKFSSIDMDDEDDDRNLQGPFIIIEEE